MKPLLIIIASVLIIVGCVTTKDKSYTKEQDFSSVDSLKHTIEDSIRKVYEEKYKEFGFYLDFYSTSKDENDQLIGQMQDAIFDSSIAADSLRKMIRDFKCPESTVKYNTDGSVEVKGKIKSLSGKILELQKSLDSARKRAEVKTGGSIIKYTNTVTVTKTKKTYPYWWLLLVCFVAGYIVRGKLPPSLIRSKIKKILPWA